ncbi:MAG: nitrous oxide reductase accessory protein NosL [Pseudomonadota bacterium]
MIVRLAAFLAVFALAACMDDTLVERPLPMAMSSDAAGHYCQMLLPEHPGPKAQIHVVGFSHPLWFSQVRDALAYTRLPEETHEVTAIYVSDMAKAESWDEPGAENWIAADAAHFVLASDRVGGMGAPEAVPFGSLETAQAFAATHRGRIVSFHDIPDAYVLGPVEVGAMPQHAAGRGEGAQRSTDAASSRSAREPRQQRLPQVPGPSLARGSVGPGRSWAHKPPSSSTAWTTRVPRG